MWVFGYGSLMWDGWEKTFGGARSDGAALRGYRRAFNKKSVEKWGTRAAPGPTLGLEPAPGVSCVGTAFEFADGRRAEIETYLRDREGPSFDLIDRPVHVSDGPDVPALTPVNDRGARTHIGNIPLAERARMARTAVGTSGACADYVRNIHAKLKSLGVVDSDVEEFAKLI